MAVSNLDVRASQPIIGGPVHIRLPSGKYIGRADIETALYAPKPIIVRDTPYTWQVYGKENTTHYNLIAGKEAGSWSSNGHQVYAFVAPVKGQKKATDLLLQHTGSKNSLKF
ncbi:hypothetical protein OC846_000890 [Tilletia horrida]|uniref:Uncharacterized protein n=1 Tax=Tilletia horrida TaxID=155126 RepID=A0AAN6K0H9_9BASI|nr:hypothetical protein OC845_001156 [Tilletia horrida]KAK0556863.1 hypothetical protein OC846_000890 [Tilletia horrida]